MHFTSHRLIIYTHRALYLQRFLTGVLVCRESTGSVSRKHGVQSFSFEAIGCSPWSIAWQMSGGLINRSCSTSHTTLFIYLIYITLILTYLGRGDCVRNL